MSSGTKVVDQRWTGIPAEFYATDCYGNKAYYSPTAFSGQGFYYKKTWSGGDSASLPYVPPVKVVAYNYGKEGPSGKEWLRSTYKVRPPKRKKKLSENAYDADILEQYHYPLRTGSRCLSGPQASSYGWETMGSWTTNFHKTWSANDDIALLGKLRERVAGGGFNAAVSLAEGKEALDTITQAATRIRRAGELLRAGSVRRAARQLMVKPKRTFKDVKRKEVTREWFADNWLQLQYGWRPLVGDVGEAAKHLASLLNRRVDQTYRARVFSVGKPVGAGSQDLGGESRVEGRYKAIVSHINEVSLAGFTDPASLIWEKLPYSFVVDWFVPVGNYLSAAGLARSLTGTFVKTLFRKLHVVSWKYNAPPSLGYFVLNPTAGYQKRIIIKRTVTSSLIVPLPQFKPLSEAVSWQHAANAVALLIKAFPRFG